MKKGQTTSNSTLNSLKIKRNRLKSLLRCSEDIDWWLLDDELGELYDDSLSWRYGFRTSLLPERCKVNYNHVYDSFLSHMKTIRDRVHKKKIIPIVTNVVKNLSRLKHFNKNSIRYVGNEYFWSNELTNPDKISYSIFNEMVEWMITKGYCTKYQGTGGCGYINITNLLVFDKEFINFCCGSDDTYKKLDESLKHPNENCVIIHNLINNVQVPRKIKPKERKEVKTIEEIVIAYNNRLERSVVEVGGHIIPEIFFRRIFNDDLQHGGRFYDHSEYLSKSKEERSKTLIDGMPTVSLDFKHLHPSLCYEMKGISLDGKDPYNVEVNLKVNKTLLNSWMEEYSILKKPNVARNLAKTALLCMINAKTRSACMAAVSKEIADDKNKRDQSKRKFVGIYDIKVKELIDSLVDHNIEISEYFFSGHGTVMQNLDSNMIDYCIKVFLSEDQVLIPVHDCIVVREDLEQLGRDTMEDAYLYIAGSSNNCMIETE